jgi:hypothetical protein
MVMKEVEIRGLYLVAAIAHLLVPDGCYSLFEDLRHLWIGEIIWTGLNVILVTEAVHSKLFYKPFTSK